MPAATKLSKLEIGEILRTVATGPSRKHGEPRSVVLLVRPRDRKHRLARSGANKLNDGVVVRRREMQSFIDDSMRRVESVAVSDTTRKRESCDEDEQTCRWHGPNEKKLSDAYRKRALIGG